MGIRNVSDRRTTARFIRRAILAASLSCALDSVSVAADPGLSREYPAVYSSRKAPWYDPFRVFTSPPKASEAKPAPVPFENASVPVSMPAPTFRQPMRPAEVSASAPVLRQPSRPVEVPALMTSDVPAPGSAQAWKWYGYGTPSHNGFGNAPIYSGAVPYVSPLRSVVTIPNEPPKIGLGVPPLFREETPVVFGSPGEGPKLPAPAVPSDVNERSAPGATLKLPPIETPAVKPEVPSASLRKPVASEEKPAPAPVEYSTPLSKILPPSKASKEIPVESAPGIAVPK